MGLYLAKYRGFGKGTTKDWERRGRSVREMYDTLRATKGVLVIHDADCKGILFSIKEDRPAYDEVVALCGCWWELRPAKEPIELGLPKDESNSHPPSSAAADTQRALV